MTKPLTVTVAGEEGNPYADLNVYVFNGETYAGYSGKTDAGGHVTFTLPEGEYHFRADYDGVQFWSGNENTCTIPGCEEDAVTLPGGTGEQEVSIDYTYDALNRLISAEYSNGTAFGYTYDAAGNVLTYAETHYGQTTVTTYTYDAANQLLTASEDDSSTGSGTVWQYSYDGNGSLIQTNPGTEVGNGSTRYTYNTAGYLTKVENYTTEWQTQSEMTYDGLGNRLEVTTYSDGEGSTTRYVLDGDAELTAIGAENTTYYLYGRGVIGTLGESWNYILSNGAGSTRQLVDEEGAVNLSVSYTPWGDTMEIYGSGNLNLGYLGGVYDAGTGLIYMGNGQYYDPFTRRFLNRGDDGQSDPYAPWSNYVASMLISPLTILAMLYGRKKKRTKFDNVFVVLVLVLTFTTSMFVVGESFIPVVSADVDRPPIGWPVQPPDAIPETVSETIPESPETATEVPVIDDCNNVEQDILLPTFEEFGVKFAGGGWTEIEKDIVHKAILAVGKKLSAFLGGISPATAFYWIYGCPFWFYDLGGGGTECIGGPQKVSCYNTVTITERLVVHELGHSFHQAIEGINARMNTPKLGPYYTLNKESIVDSEGNFIGGWDDTTKTYKRTLLGYKEPGVPYMYHGPDLYPNDWDQYDGKFTSRNEDFADMYMNWVYDSFAEDSAGEARYTYIENHMVEWILLTLREVNTNPYLEK